MRTIEAKGTNAAARAGRGDGPEQEELLEALRSVGRGDFSVRLPTDGTGIGVEIAEAFNEVVELNARTARELRRISRIVGRQGRIAERASIREAGGEWARNVESVNALIDQLTQPAIQVSAVLGAVARGDLSRHMSLDASGRPLRGEFLRWAEIVNTMVDQLNAFASEVTRVAREVGTEGKLGGQADVRGVGGTWKDLTDSVNSMAGNLTSQVRNIAEVTTAVAQGDLSKKITVDVHGEILQLKDTINTMVDQLNAFASEVTRVAREVGTEGKLGGQADVRGVGGTWKDLTDSVNFMASNLTSQVRNIAEVTTAVARGDLSKKIAVDVHGEVLELKDTINTMVDQLNRLASEVTRVAHEVGTEGKLGGQAQVPDVGGIWKELTDNLNIMSASLTDRARNIAEVTTAVAMGDLSRKITLDVRGEFLEQKNTINTMVDQLNAFASEVTRVAREVGTEGRLGGQADVRGVAGTWKDLTDSVNQLAANLTTQVRAIGDVATAVTRGDLSRAIEVEASGEVEVLKDDLNEMIRRLRDTTRENADQVWLKANLARFSGMLQGQRDLESVGQLILSELAPLVGVLSGALYLKETEKTDGEEPALRLLASYAREGEARLPTKVQIGEGLLGEAARERRRIVVSEVPASYLTIKSALGEAPPHMVAFLPIVFEGETQAVIELASFDRFTETQLAFLDQLGETIGLVLNAIAANAKAAAFVQEQAARAEAEAGLARLRQVVDVMPEGIMLADAAGSIYLHNAAAAEILGEVPTSVIPTTEGVPIYRRLDGSVSPPEDQPLARAVFRQEVVRGEQLIVTNAITGREVPILVNSAPLSDTARLPAGGVTVFQDITPLHDLDRQRDEFLAAISHDLRTPVAIIKGRTNLLQRAVRHSDPPDPTEVASGLQTIDDSTVHLVRLIDELLDLMRLRMGHAVTLDLASTDLIEIARRLADEYQKMSPDHPIRVEAEADSLVGTWDKARLERVVSNLLSNAVKYGAHGGEIHISVAQEVDDGKDWAVLAVRNHGLGIPAGELDRVFDVYYRGSNVSETISGTGVGLAGARHIVEQHGGSIGAESVPGEATAFTVRLPLNQERASSRST